MSTNQVIFFGFSFAITFRIVFRAALASKSVKKDLEKAFAPALLRGCSQESSGESYASMGRRRKFRSNQNICKWCWTTCFYTFSNGKDFYNFTFKTVWWMSRILSSLKSFTISLLWQFGKRHNVCGQRILMFKYFETQYWNFPGDCLGPDPGPGSAASWEWCQVRTVKMWPRTHGQFTYRTHSGLGSQCLEFSSLNQG